jgi:hypothetical protein
LVQCTREKVWGRLGVGRVGHAVEHGASMGIGVAVAPALGGYGREKEEWAG